MAKFLYATCVHLDKFKALNGLLYLFSGKDFFFIFIPYKHMVSKTYVVPSLIRVWNIVIIPTSVKVK